jgi:hypothetical protein
MVKNEKKELLMVKNEKKELLYIERDDFSGFIMSRNGKKEVLIIGELLIPVPGLRSQKIRNCLRLGQFKGQRE